MPQAHYLTALQHYRNNQLEQAESVLQQALALQPNHADALHMLGVICYQTNRTSLAVQHIAKALKISPRNLDYLNNYGLALSADNQLDAAVKSFQQAILLQPKDLDVQLNLGNTLLTLNRYEEAAGYYRRVLRALPKQDDIRAALCHCLTSLGNEAQSIGNYTQAEACFQEALLFNAQDSVLYYNLGNAQRELGKSAEAAKQYQKATQLSPNDADAYNNLGNVQRELGQLDLAIESYKQALSINPALYHAKVHLAHQKQHICDWQGLQEDIAEIRHWVKNLPQAQISPFAFLAMPTTTAEEQKTCANNWVKNRYAALIKQGEQLNFTYLPNNNKKIRIGYLSADFRLHPLAFLVSELIELHDRTIFEIVAFSYGVNDKSSARTRLEKAFDQFHDIRHLSEIDAAKKINACNIDILVDLTGFTQTSRSGIVALRPAPINVNWLGFPGTMGGINEKPLYDYILSDSFISPPDSAHNYAETLALLPHSYQPNDCKRPIGKLPSREACGLQDNAFVFCCFNQTFKITPDIFAIWISLLKALPNSVLWLLDCNTWAKQNLIREAALQGIYEDQLIFAPRVSIADHLARHVHADLFLDTLPYNAHTTCSDALWMGLPVLTCAGDTFAARVAASLLNAADMTDLITYSLQDYENKALYLANNPSKLLELKQKLLATKMTSNLFDTDKFSKSLEEIYQKIYSATPLAP
ncbi:tetratricopeptide repeat protein [Methylotenera sp.]|uniref:O-linked N-acetylglucosamine transferase, SPINDLY family protein n=2 Tax=Methylotenera sp. TaxID=2051956 RepID=UPI0027196388|nr:tetratricopeptide repeat protein [Methylotenera sp.]MDO9204431.1 tetratricopeptide repeat protein [Methylotenera sp.]MDP1521964.1 tetratricopeptide repeat protein [Methylotenera sp.]MDP3309108.1 tetratricopeptide repeat protein [Methylotenera sp.]MDP3819545.1 tetratricopeptide repeat protein [Methylotenera sp.]